MASKNSDIEKEGCKSGPNTGGSECKGKYRLRKAGNLNPFKRNSGKLITRTNSINSIEFHM